MSVSDDSDSILPNLQKTRELWNQKSGENSADFLLPKSPISPLKATNSPPPVMENHVNGTQEEGEEVVVRFEDKADDDFDMPDVKSIKSQWEKAGPVSKPIKVAPSTTTTTRKHEGNHSTPQLVPVNRDQEENKEEYDVQLGQLREKFEKESKATSSARVVWNDSPRRTVSKDAVDDKKNISTTTDVVRYEDTPAEEPAYEVEISSLRMRFEQPSVSQKAPTPRGRTPVQKKVSDTNIQQQRAPQESENVKEIFRSSDAKYEQMIGEESVKVRLARYMAMTEAAKPQATERNSYKRRSTTDLVIKKKVEEEAPATGEQEIIRSPPAGTKEKPDYTASIDLEQARQLFEQKSPSPTRGRSSRSSSNSPFRRSPRSRSTPSPINRSSRSISLASSKSPSPSRQSSGRRSPSKKSVKKFGDPDVVVLEHTEVNYYYDSDGTRLSTRTQGLDNLDRSTDNMSEPEVIRPAPAGTKEEADFVPTVNLHSVRDMFENAKAEDQSRARAPPQKRTVVIEKQKEEESAGNSPERNPDIIRSTAAGTREEPQFELSIDLKAARSKFESPLRPESYVPRNKIKEREVEVRRLRVAAAAASPRSSESSDSGYEVVKTAEAGSKEKPDYQVDLKAAKQLFEGGRAPAPVYVKRESSTTTARQHTQIAGEVIRPEPAGTKEVIEIHTSKDVRSVKEKFESSTKEDVDEETNRKPPIDIHEEAREVIRKEKEVMEEVQQPDDESEPKLESGVESESDHTDTEGEMILEHDSDHEPQEAISDVAEERTPSVSSEELVEAEELVENSETEQEEEEMVEASEEQKNADDEDEQSPAAAVVPVRVAIPEDFNEKKEEPEVQQQYETYEKVIDYNEEAHHPAQSDSDSEKDVLENSTQEIRKDEQVIIIDDDGLKQNGFKDDNADSSYESNEAQNDLDDFVSSEKGISSTSSNQDDSKQQLSFSSSSQPEGVEIAGKTNAITNNLDPFAEVLQTTEPKQTTPAFDPFSDRSSIVGPPQLPPQSIEDLFGGFGDIRSSNDPFDPFSSSNPTPAPRLKKDVPIEPAGSSLIDTSDDEDFDKPHFNYPYEDDESSASSKHVNENPITNNSNNLDIFGLGVTNEIAATQPNNNSNNLDIFGLGVTNEITATQPNNQLNAGMDLFADFNSESDNAHLADIGVSVTSVPASSEASAVDPFDIFAKPASTQQPSSEEKDPFDLFA